VKLINALCSVPKLQLTKTLFGPLLCYAKCERALYVFVLWLGFFERFEHGVVQIYYT